MYWTIPNKDKKYFNKLSALIDAQGDVDKISFHLFPESFDSIDWTKEPPENWSYLLKERSVQLRDEYPYLRLFYSGGSDSHTILLAFIKNKIPLDEIVVFRSSLIDDFELDDNTEANDRALAYLKTIRRTNLKRTKITILDVGNKEYERAFQDPEQWFLKKNDWDVRSILSNPSLYFLFPELEEPINKGKDIADILGTDKAMLGKDEEGYFTHHLDSNLTYNLGAPFDEYFFTSPNFPQLHLKQTHLLRNLLEEEFSHMDNLEIFYENPGPFVKEYNSLCRDQCWNHIDLGKFNSFKEGFLWASTIKAAYASQAAQEDNPKLYQKFQDLFDYIPVEVLKSFNDPLEPQSRIFGSFARKYYL